MHCSLTASPQTTHKRNTPPNTGVSNKRRNPHSTAGHKLEQCIHKLLATTSHECIEVKVYDVDERPWFQGFQGGPTSAFGERLAYPGSVFGNSGYGLQAVHLARRLSSTGDIQWTLPTDSPWSHLTELNSVVPFIADGKCGNTMPGNEWFLAAVLLGIVIKFDTRLCEQLYSIFAIHLIAAGRSGDTLEEWIETMQNQGPHLTDSLLRNQVRSLLVKLEGSLLFSNMSTASGVFAMNIHSMLNRCPWDDTARLMHSTLTSTVECKDERRIADYYARVMAAVILRQLASSCPWYDEMCLDNLQRLQFVQFVSDLSVYAALINTPYAREDPSRQYDALATTTSLFLPCASHIHGPMTEHSKLLLMCSQQHAWHGKVLDEQLSAVESCILREPCRTNILWT